MNWIYYLLEANFYLVIFYGFYYFALRRETYYQFNRAYLLITCILSFIIPLLQVGILKNNTPLPSLTAAPTVIIVNHGPIKVTPTILVKIWTVDDYCMAVYEAVVLLMVLNLSLKLFKLYNLTHTANKVKSDAFYLVETEDNNAFSFLKYVFINPKMADESTVMRHEMVHIRQKHSLDILFLELFKIINWFNPVAYLVQGSIRELHEFVADRETVNRQMSVDFYSNYLLQNAYSCSENALTNNFFNKNLLKKRIIMLYQKPSGSLARLKYLVTIPLCALLLCVSTIGFSKTYGWIDLIPNKTAAMDSNAPVAKTPKMRFPPPNFIRGPYGDLANYIRNNMRYPQKAMDNHNSGMVIVSFNLGNDKLISSVTISNGVGYGFDETAAEAVKSYQKPINDKPGQYKIGVGFYSFYSGKQIKIKQQTMGEPNFIGDVLIVDKVPNELKATVAPANTSVTLQPPPPSDKPVTLQPPPPSDKPDMQQNMPAQQSAVTEKVALHQLLTPPGSIKLVKLAELPLVSSPAQSFDSLYKYIAKYTRYPTKARANLVAGRVIVGFTVAEGKITNAKIARGIDPEIDGELLRVIKNFDAPLDPALRNYDISVSFVIINAQGKLAGGSPFENKDKTGIKVTDVPLINSAPYYMLNEVVVPTYL